MHWDVRNWGETVQLELTEECEGLEVVLAFRRDGELHELAEMEPPVTATLGRRPVPGAGEDGKIGTEVR